MLSTRKDLFRQFVVYLSITLFSLVFITVYYLNSYGMKEAHMSLLFIPPLVGTVVFLLLYLFKYPLSNYSRYAFNMAFPFFYLYMLLTGIYSIAKTNSKWLFVFAIIGGAQMLAAIVLEIVIKCKKSAKTDL